jgi:hypothetical protein
LAASRWRPAGEEEPGCEVDVAVVIAETLIPCGVRWRAYGMHADVGAASPPAPRSSVARSARGARRRGGREEERRVGRALGAYPWHRPELRPGVCGRHLSR